VRLVILPVLVCAASAVAQTGAPIAARNAPTTAPGPINLDAWQERTEAELVLLDKVRAQPRSATLRVGQSLSFGALTISLRRCVAHPPDQTQDSAALLDITDSHASIPRFRGWMLANEPAISQLEHPLYDVHVAACR